MRRTIDVKSVTPIYNEDGIVGRRFYDTPEAQAIQLTFDKGAFLPEHQSPVDVLIYILSGKAEICVGNEKITAEKGQAVSSPKKSGHAIRNIGDSVMEILVVKAPRP